MAANPEIPNTAELCGLTFWGFGELAPGAGMAQRWKLFQSLT